MPPRILSLVIMATVIGVASPAAAKEKPAKKKAAKQAPRTWKTMVDYVMKNGGEDSINAPTTRALGYDADEVAAKSLGLDPEKSNDGRDHSIFIVYGKDQKGLLTPKEIVIGNIRIKETDSKKEIDGYQIRMNLDGVPIKGLHVGGIFGEANLRALGPESTELRSVHKKESDFHLKEVDLKQLSQ